MSPASRRTAFGMGFVAVALAAARSALAPGGFGSVLGIRFDAPHRVDAPRAEVTGSLAREFEGLLLASDATGPQALVDMALEETGQTLHFGLSHRTNLTFDGKEREGNCVEYSHLFSELFNRAARKRGVGAHAYVVRSEHVTMHGHAFSEPALRTHDWVLVVEPSTGRRWYIDPAFSDAGLGWNIETRVHGAVPLRG